MNKTDHIYNDTQRHGNAHIRCPWLVVYCLFLSAVFSVITSCKKRPDYILSKGKMEQVLYDYHLAQAMTDNGGWSAENKQRTTDNGQPATTPIDLVFQKHGITAAAFDSSLIYYNAHAAELRDIYSKLKERYTAENERLQLATGNSELAAVITAGGDTANIWSAPPLLLLRSRDLLRRQSFSIKPDTSFHPLDRFVLVADVSFAQAPMAASAPTLTCGLSIQDADGTTVGQTTQTTQSAHIRLDVASTDTLRALRSLSAFFYYTADTATRSLCFIDNVQLIRMHADPHAPSAEADTTHTTHAQRSPADTAAHPADTVRRLSPQELRRRNQGDTRIRIKAAPDRRTPNSVGPSRRTPRRQ